MRMQDVRMHRLAHLTISKKSLAHLTIVNASHITENPVCKLKLDVTKSSVPKAESVFQFNFDLFLI